MKIYNLQGKEILEIPGNTLQGADLQGANLQGADLQWANLQGADLQGANLYKANLYKANLQKASLQETKLQEANLQWADLREADLREADLQKASLYGADLQGADLRWVYLQGAYLQGAYLQGAKLPHYKICPETGGFYAWKKTTKGIIKIYIPSDAKRLNPLVSRKCRASKIKIVSGLGCGGQSPTHHEKITYEKNQTYEIENFNDDIRIACAPGIHFFMTEKEATEW